jgi:hypothetical protein
MRRNSWLLSALTSAALIASVASTDVAGADELKMTSPSQGSVDHPARGMSMDKVESKFGAPTTRVPAVGNPPITRWEYPGFTVYFEHNIVLHSVVKPS